MGFVQLHCHNHVGSRLDGIASCEQYAERAYELGHKALACTDHGKLSAFWEHQQACKKYGIKPIFGVEAYVTDKLITTELKKEEEKRIRSKNYHIILLAKNEAGYKNLLKLNYLSMADTEHFYYMNRNSHKELYEHSEGLIATTGCLGSPFNRRIRDGKIEEAIELFERYYEAFGEDFYGEVQLNEFSFKNSENGEQQLVNNFIIEQCEKRGIPVIIGGDVHYLNPGEDWIQTLSIAIRNKDTIDNLTFQIESKNLYYHDTKDYIKFNEEFGYKYEKTDIIKWCNNASEVADKVSYEIPERNKIYLPSVSDNDESLIINKSRKGLCFHLNVQTFEEIEQAYRERLEKELEIIIRKGFASYILILEDIFQFAEENNLYRGPARGSAAGSLVCYALGITTLDPIKYNLLFERFMSEQRSVDMVYNYWDE